MVITFLTLHERNLRGGKKNNAAVSSTKDGAILISKFWDCFLIITIFGLKTNSYSLCVSIGVLEGPQQIKTHDCDVLLQLCVWSFKYKIVLLRLFYLQGVFVLGWSMYLVSCVTAAESASVVGGHGQRERLRSQVWFFTVTVYMMTGWVNITADALWLIVIRFFSTRLPYPVRGISVSNFKKIVHTISLYLIITENPSSYRLLVDMFASCFLASLLLACVCKKIFWFKYSKTGKHFLPLYWRL